MFETNKIYHGDCRNIIPNIDNESIDLVISSPPYNVNLGDNRYHKNPYDLYNDNKDHHDYIRFLTHVFGGLLYDKMKKGGRVCINIGDGKNGAVPTASDITQFMVRASYIPYTHIIWDKSQVGNRCAWGSFMSPSSPSFPTPFEHILVFAKETKKLQWKGETDLTKKEFIDWSLALWKFAPETKQKKMGHNAMFPQELPRRLIKMLSYKDAVVLDPFSGLGTTALVAKSLGRRYIGIELSKEYCDKSRERIESEVIK